MKNKLIYLIAVLFAANVCFSCNDNDDDPVDFTGTWEYGQKGDVHFVFEYAEENISIPAGIANLIPVPGFPSTLPVSMVQQVLPGYAKGQMQKYFRGITFLPNREMEILMTAKGEPVSVKTTYEIQNDVLKLNIQSDDFKKLTGDNIPAMIRSVDLNYSFENDKLTLYLDTKYIKVLLNAAPAMMANAAMEDALKQEINAFISELSRNIKTLEIGAILAR